MGTGSGRINTSVDKRMNAEDLRSSFLARMDLVSRKMMGLVEEHQHEVANALLKAGIHLIPCEHLQDHQFVVSPGVYEAAKKICHSKGVV